jgi:hypothetical protein
LRWLDQPLHRILDVSTSDLVVDGIHFVIRSMRDIQTLRSEYLSLLFSVINDDYNSICGLQKLRSGHLSLTLRRLDYHRILHVSTSDIVIDGLHSVIHRMRNIQILHNWYLSLLFSVIDDGYNTMCDFQNLRIGHSSFTLRRLYQSRHRILDVSASDLVIVGERNIQNLRSGNSPLFAVINDGYKSIYYLQNFAVAT